MPLLFPNLRTTQVFGANTDVGKTLLTTALLRATAQHYAQTSPAPITSTFPVQRKRVFYLKPVSTGPDDEADDSFVKRNTGSWKSAIETKCLYQYRDPVSPHLAARLSPDLPFPTTNSHLLHSISNYVTTSSQASSMSASLYLETAGAPHSPSLHPPMTQLASLRPLLMPTILVFAPQLGGIGTTISAWESLVLAGYNIQAVLGLRESVGRYKNEEFLRDWFEAKKIPVWDFPAPPQRASTPALDGQQLEHYYQSLEAETGMGSLSGLVKYLEDQHKERIEELGSMPRRTLDQVWWPFTQHGLVRVNKEEQVMVVDSAHGDYFDAFYSAPKPVDSNSPNPITSGMALAKTVGEKSLLNPLFDGSASWFTQAHTHGHPSLTLAAAHAAARYGHLLFPSSTHAPALQLAEKLLTTVGKEWAARVFYSDNGSTGMEVALKVAIRAAGKRYGWEGGEGEERGVIGLRGGYHGDTIGAMDATEQGIYNTVVDWYQGRGHWFSPPVVMIQNGTVTISSTGPDQWPAHSATPEVNQSPDSSWLMTMPSFTATYDVGARLSTPLAAYYRNHIRKTLERLTQEERQRFGTLIIEPICLGAGGMVFVDPLFQRCLVDVIRSSEDLFSVEGNAITRTGVKGDGEWEGLPVIYDEVFSGLNRLSYTSAASVLGVSPDVACYAKILTGGLLPLSATLASKSMFEAFLHPTKKVDALLHGHSYTANPIGCAVALKALEMVEEKSKEKHGNWVDGKQSWGLNSDGGDDLGNAGLWSLWDETWLRDVSQLAGVKGTMAMGTVLAIELEEPSNATFSGYASSMAQDFLDSLRTASSTCQPPSDGSAQFPPFEIHSRPLGNVLYFITSLWTEIEVVRSMQSVIMDKLRSRS